MSNSDSLKLHTSFNSMGFYTNGLVSHHKEDEDKDNLVYSDGVLISGSLDSLILHLVPTSQYLPDSSYIFAFLLNSRQFLSPNQLLQKVCETCMIQQGLKSEKLTAESLGMFGPNMIRLLSEWTDNFPYDFRDERMVKHLKEMTQILITLYPSLRRNVNLLTHNLYSKLQALHKYEDLLKKINAEVTNRLHSLLINMDIVDVCSSSLQLSEQLTHIELERLSMIGPEEFINNNPNKDKSTDSLSNGIKQTENIESYVQWYNRLSYLIATEICMHLKKKNRVRIIQYFVDVAKECVNIGNFNSLMAIIGGLNMPSIQRLKKTWAKVNKEKLDILEHQTNPSNNFSSYRSSLKAALWRSGCASEERGRIIVPFFSVLVKDILVINEGWPNQLANGHINFEKFWKLKEVTSEFITWKHVECPFERCPIVLNYLLTNPIFTENSLSLASYECEQPDNSFERQHHKQLKEQAGL